MYGSETNIQCLKVMKFAPVIYCINAAWLFSNQQVFRNKVLVNDTD